MCGITGFVNFDNLNNYQNVLKEIIVLNLEVQIIQIFTLIKKNHVALGHNRLSIIDLNKRSNQPLKSNNE